MLFLDLQASFPRCVRTMSCLFYDQPPKVHARDLRTRTKVGLQRCCARLVGKWYARCTMMPILMTPQTSVNVNITSDGKTKTQKKYKYAKLERFRPDVSISQRQVFSTNATATRLSFSLLEKDSSSAKSTVLECFCLDEK